MAVLAQYLVVLVDREVGHEGERVASGDGCRVEHIDVAVVARSDSDAAHGFVVGRARHRKVSYAVDGIGGVAGVGATVPGEGRE